MLPATLFTAKQLKNNNVPLTTDDMFDFDCWYNTFNLYIFPFTGDSIVYCVKTYSSTSKFREAYNAINSKVIGGGITSSIEADLANMAENTSGDINMLVTDLSIEQECIIAMHDMGCVPEDTT